MSKKELMIKAHEMTKKIKTQYPEVDYKFQLGLCLAYLYENEGDVEMVELKGTEKQVAWANEIREVVLEMAERSVKLMAKRYEERPRKAWLTRMNLATERLEMFKNEESAVYFIENFKYLLTRKNELVKANIENIQEELAYTYADLLERL